MNKRRFGLVVAWMAATAMATLLASQAVALVRDQVTDRPSRVATTLAMETTTSATASPTTSTPAPSQPSTITTGVAPTTSIPTATSSTSQPVAPTSTAPTAPTSVGDEQTYFLTGGWATVQCSGDGVALITYAPNPGYKVEIESAGPAEVEITFEATGDEHESQLEARCDDGVLDPRIEDGDHD